MTRQQAKNRKAAQDLTVLIDRQHKCKGFIIIGREPVAGKDFASI